jgi:transcriptional regulator with PAS, ATPase and Fis domain
MENENHSLVQEKNPDLIKKIYGKENDALEKSLEVIPAEKNNSYDYEESSDPNNYEFAETVVEEEPLSLLEKEIEMIKKSLKRSNGKRKIAAKELGISERTLYRKIKQFDLQDLEDE